jgi:hypothetical protein
MIFPVVLKTRVYVEPRAAIHYRIAENGAFQVTDAETHRAVTRVKGPVPGLVPEEEHVCLKFPRVPRAQVEEVVAFFEEAYRRWKGEAMVLVFYRAATREFRIAVPYQTLPGRRRHDGRWQADHAVRYGTVERPAECVRLGTIHSHGELAAYASGQDCADEQYEDGLHVVFGSFAAREPSVSASFVANGVRFVLEPADVLEPWGRSARPARPDWLARVAPEEEEHADTKAPRRAGG